MNVCENTRGCPSTVLCGVFAGFAVGPLPWTTVPETVTSRFGGVLPVPIGKTIQLSSDQSEKRTCDGANLGWGGNRTTALRVWWRVCR